ncbi:MAG: PepSY-associated TM helix domain-containing protein [Pseudomonadota bacterium]|nr:PepSY-associated TM helix domain-containing protein [Pseudomonadota bacterium]
MKHWTKHPYAQKVFRLSRWIHVYFSVFLLALLLFFCLTGFTLNHADWFNANKTVNQTEFVLAEVLQKQLQAGEQLPKSLLLAEVRQKTGLVNPSQIDWDLESGFIGIDYQLPAGYAYVEVLIDDARMVVEHQHAGFIALVNDLHKGRHSGAVWSWVIDICAFAMTLFSVAGLLIMFQNKRYRPHAIPLFSIGFIAPLWLYFAFVPKF